MAELPKWRCEQASYLNHTLWPEGSEVHFEPPEGGQVSDNLHPMNNAAQAWLDGQKDDHPAKAKAKKRGKGAVVAEEGPSEAADSKATEDEDEAY